MTYDMLYVIWDLPIAFSFKIWQWILTINHRKWHTLLVTPLNCHINKNTTTKYARENRIAINQILSARITLVWNEISLAKSLCCCVTSQYDQCWIKDCGRGALGGHWLWDIPKRNVIKPYRIIQNEYPAEQQRKTSTKSTFEITVYDIYTTGIITDVSEMMLYSAFPHWSQEQQS